MIQCEPYQLCHFTKSKKIGKGGFGTAFIARLKSYGMEVCLKTLPWSKGVWEEEIDGEAKMLSKLKDEHLL